MMFSHNHFIAGNAANHLRNCREAARLLEQNDRELITVYDDGVPVPGDTANPFNPIQEAETAAERYENTLWLVWFRIRRACRCVFCRNVFARRDTLRRMSLLHHQMFF